MSHRFRTTSWQCPRCRRKTTTRHLFEDGCWSNVYQESGPPCTGMISGSHSPVEMTMTGYKERPATGNGPVDVPPVRHHTAETKEYHMTTPPFGYAQGGLIQPPEPRFPRQHPWSEILNSFNEDIERMRRQAREQREASKPENQFRALKVIEGDRIRLTTKTSPDASQLEGDVIGIKVRDAGSQVRIKGFDHTGGNAGGQHVWFPVANYTVEVLHRAYRWTSEDEAVVEVSRLPRDSWVKATEEYRERKRKQYAPRIARLREVLGTATV